MLIKIGATDKPIKETVEASRNLSLFNLRAFKLDLILQNKRYKINNKPIVPCS